MHLSLKLPVLAGLLLSAALFARGSAAPAEAYPGSEFPTISAACNTDGTVLLHIAWTTYGTGPQWMDLSLYNNGFAPGTFVGFGPGGANINSVTWTGILNNTNYYLRLNTQTPTAWYPSETVSFTTTPCPVVSQVSVVVPAPVFIPIQVIPIAPAPPPIPIFVPIPGPTPPGPPTTTPPPTPTTTPPGSQPAPSQLPY